MQVNVSDKLRLGINKKNSQTVRTADADRHLLSINIEHESVAKCAQSK